MSDAQHDWHSQDTYRSLIDYGTNMLQFCFLSNGGATIALLTFVGDLSSKAGSVPDMRLPAVLFVAGVFLAGVAGALAYLVQFTLFNEALGTAPATGWRSHVRWLKLAFACIVLSILAFGCGSLLAVARL